MSTLVWIALAWLALVAAGAIGWYAGVEHGRGLAPPSWREVRVLDAWSIGREAGRREVITELLSRRGAENTARMDPAHYEYEERSK